MEVMKLFGLTTLASVFLLGCAAESATDTESTHNSESTTESVSSEDANSDRVSFMGVGDNLIHDSIFKDAETDTNKFDFKPIYEPVAGDLAAADLAYINQETLLGGDEFGFSGYPAFNSPSALAGDLVDIGFDIATGGNNHSLDKGAKGIANALEYWGKFKDQILFTGIFDRQEKRDEIPVIERNGMTFSVLSYTTTTNGIEPDYPYQVNYFDPELIKDDVKRAQEVSDFVIVAAHWGEEHDLVPNAEQEGYAQLFADLGVDVVIGNHSHTIQPVEWVEGQDGHETLVAYSLGNFLSASLYGENILGGTINFDFVNEDEDYYIDNVSWEPVVTHFTKEDENDIMGSRRNFKVYFLEDYSDELADQHAIQGYEGNEISMDFFQNLASEVVSDEFYQSANSEKAQ